MPQNEVNAPVPVVDDTGRPGNFGWSRSPCFVYDPGLLWAPRRRISESDRYILFSSTHLLVMEVRDDGYQGYMGVSVISLKDKKHSTHIHLQPLPLGGFSLPTDSTRGSIKLIRGKNRLDFAVMEGGVRIIRADFPWFGHHRSLRGELVLFEPAVPESLVTNMPWRREKNSFRCSRRSPWYTVEGVVQFGSSEMVFTRGNAWGIFDWNRGVRPRSDLRFWAAGCGITGSQQLSFSVGYGSEDASQGTENAFFVNGKLHKLDQVTFHISPADHLLPWRFTSNDGRLEMTFTPNQERVEWTGLVFYSMTRRQVCGRFSGRVILDDGSEVKFREMTGFAERLKSSF
ncbi:MAG: DUF2804 domain-containing protein [Treponema sp.]|jgi:hypothetical protein|nr:DUF2804 domain-containing protein [Treponema sp.]